jgi:hypothetical protein
MIWRRHDPHPSTHAAVALLTELYRRHGAGDSVVRLSPAAGPGRSRPR